MCDITNQKLMITSFESTAEHNCVTHGGVAIYHHGWLGAEPWQ